MTPPAERVSEPTSDPDIEVRTYFARGRNALIARGDFSEIFAAWYLHRMDHGIELPAAMEDAAREAIASITLHSASRPWKEACAWTVKFPDPRLNVFAAADNHTGSVIANFQTSELQPIGDGMFYADVVEEAAAAGDCAVEAQLFGDDLAEEANFDGVAQHVLAVAGAVVQLAHSLDDLGVQAAEVDFEGGFFAKLDDLLADFALDLFDDFFDSSGVHAAVGDEAFEAFDSDSLADFVEA